MANEFIIKKGLISKANSIVSGSLIVTDGVSGSFSGSFEGDGSGLTNVPTTTTASYALTASYVETAQTASYVLNAISSSYTSFAVSASYAVSSSHEIIKEVSSSYADTASFAQSGNGIFSGSFSGSYVGNGNALTGIISSSYAISASYSANSDLLDGKDSTTFTSTSSFNSFTSSYYIDSASIDIRITNNSSSITALSSSYLLSSASFSSDILINSASISYLSSSFLSFSGSYNTGSFTGSFIGDGSSLIGVVSSSFAITASYILSSSIDGISNYVRNNQTSSMSVLSSSFATTASYILNAISSSYSTYATTASYVENAQTASYVLNAISSSYSTFALSALSASYAPGSPTISSSYAETASYVNPLTQDVDITGQTDITGNVLVTGSLTVSGSNSTVNLQELQFDTEHIATGHSTGRMYWDDSNKTATLDMQGSDVRLQLGQESHVYAKNISGVTIANGDAVRISGATGANLNIEKAVSKIKSFKSSTEEDEILGIATEEITNNSSGYVTTFGSVSDLNTSAFAEGDILYLSNTTSGSYTNSKPPAPYFQARVGVVKVSNNGAGVIISRPQEPTFLTDIAQVTSSGVIPNEKTYLCYDDSTDLIQFTNEFSGSFSGSFEGDGRGLTEVSNTLRSVTSTDTFSTHGETINCTSGTFTVNLPTAVGIQGIEYTLVNSGTGTITLDAFGTETINGSLTIDLKRQYTSRTVQSDNANWIII